MKTRLLLLVFLSFCLLDLQAQNDAEKRIKELLSSSILERADKALSMEPITVTAETCERSEGGKHDFYSEGDYWWSNPENPDGPYIRRDGETNPNNFTAHRKAMIRMSMLVGDLTSAWVLTNDKKYTDAAIQHINAWFITPDTRMNPNLQYAQAIKGIATGRGIGIIDTIHLIEVVKSIMMMEQAGLINYTDLREVKQWFAEYLNWISTHPYGVAEMNAKNNHGTCWTMQAAAFALLTRDNEKIDFCINRYKEVLLPNQMAADGSFPLELERTKPYGYALFNLDAMATICQLLSTEEDNLWEYQTKDGKSISKGVAWMYPYIKKKSSWKLTPDIMYWDEWPVAQPALLFSVLHKFNKDYFNTWAHLEHFPTNEEVIRNLPIRNPLLWLDNKLNTRIYDARKLIAIKQSTSPAYKKAKEKVQSEAEKILSKTPPSVMDKEMIPTSGDKHDYMSMGPYWWPDPSKPDGLPYIRRDGERNPELDKLDRNKLGNMAESVATLGLAYFFSEEEKYAEKAVEYLKVWFLNPKTKMNPNLNFGQTIPGRNNGLGRGTGLIDTYSFVKMLEAVEMISTSKAMSQSVKRELKAWFAEFTEWMTSSKVGLEEDEALNNHGLAYDVQLAVFAHFAGNYTLTDKVLRNFAERRLFPQIEPDGSQPLELERTTAFGYTVFNITHMLDMSALGVKRGIDIYHQVSPDGRSISAALKFIIPYIGKPQSEWPWKQIKEWNEQQNNACWLLRRASFYDPEAGYEEISAKYRKTSPSSVLHLLYSLE